MRGNHCLTPSLPGNENSITPPKKRGHSLSFLSQVWVVYLTILGSHVARLGNTTSKATSSMEQTIYGTAAE